MMHSFYWVMDLIHLYFLGKDYGKLSEKLLCLAFDVSCV